MTTLDPMGFSPLTETLQVLETASELNVSYSVENANRTVYMVPSNGAAPIPTFDIQKP